MKIPISKVMSFKGISVAAAGLVLAIIASVIGFTSPANAADSTTATTVTLPSCDTVDMTVGNGDCLDQNQLDSVASASASDSTIAKASLKGKVVGVFEEANGAKLKASDKTAKGCPLVDSFAAGMSKGGKCFRLTRGAKYMNSMELQDGSLFWFLDYVGSKTSPDAPWVYVVLRDGKWVKAGDKAGDYNCRNWLKPPTSTKQTVTNIVLLRSWTNFTFTLHMKWDSASTVHVVTKSWCHANGSAATASGNASATATDQGHFDLKVKGLIKAKATLKSQEAALREQQKINIAATAQMTAVTKVQADASSHANCTGAPPTIVAPSIFATANACVAIGQQSGVVKAIVGNPNALPDTATVTVGSQSQSVALEPGASATLTFSGYSPGTYNVSAHLATANKTNTTSVTVQQCAVTPPSFLNVTQLNDLSEGDSSPNFKVTYQLPNNDAGTLYLSTTYGYFTLTNDRTAARVSSISVSGFNSVTLVYWAPNDSTATSNLTETIKVNLTDSVTGLSAAQQSQSFPIKPIPVRPARVVATSHRLGAQ